MIRYKTPLEDKSRLVGTNRVEVLLFSLGKDCESGREELFGINVFKVLEVIRLPEITRAPNMPESVEGMVSLRGKLVPVVNLQKFCQMQSLEPLDILIITEFNSQVQGFMVHSVDGIQRLTWNELKAPPPMLVNRLGGLTTAVTELEDQRLLMILDVEKVLAETTLDDEDDSIFSDIESLEQENITVLFADDSSVARKQIIKTLDSMAIKHYAAANGVEAWKKLNDLAELTKAAGRPITDRISLVLTDVEMPEMDGYVLTRKIKGDSRFESIPVIMHSSLTSENNQKLGKEVGADAYVSKFDPRELAKVLCEVIHNVGRDLTEIS